MAAPILKIEKLIVDFRSAVGDTRAVDGLSLELRAREVLALVGESGSGKSMTARAIFGLLPDTGVASGSIRLDGQELLGLPEAQLRPLRGKRMAMVFQEPSTALNPVQTVGWQIAEAIRAHHGRLQRAEVRQRVIEMLTLVGIPEPDRRRRHYPHQFSGGQRQRIVIALALVNEPELLIADEPTTALDVTVQAEILDLLRELATRMGTATLLITHNMGVVADLADSVAVMREGRIVEVDTVQNLFSAPKAAYTRELLAAVPKIGEVAGEPERGPAEPVFCAERIAVEYRARGSRRTFRALDGVSARIGAGEVVGVVGESGSGKSTLGRVALGLLRPAAGSATLFGSSLRELDRRELRALRRRVGVVYQDPAASLDPLWTVAESISEPLRIHNVGTASSRADRVRELLEAVALPASYAERRPIELSGGQRQRVALARALALGPELIIADEPTSALDVSVQAIVLELFRSLQEQLGFACLFISHDLAVVNEVSDHVLVLRGGVLVEEGSPAVVLREPEADYTRELIAAAPVADPIVQAARREARLSVGA